MSKIKHFLLWIGILFLKICYFFIKLLSTKKRITFISRQSDSITLDFSLLKKELNKDLKDYETIFLMKMLPGGENAKLSDKIKYLFHMFKQMYYIATSKVVILDSYCIVISVLNHKKSLKVIQIWHAIGSMKKFGYAMIGKEEGSSAEIAKLLKMHKNYDCVLISSKSFIKDFIEGFNITEDIIKEIPLPRADIYLNDEYKKKKRAELYKRIPKLKNKKNILYCGTFRKQKNQNSNHIDDLTKHIDFNKYNLLYKPHPFNKIIPSDKRIIQNFNSTLEALLVSDYVICDYSSIMYEVGLLNLPLFIYAYDWDSYKNKRELNFDIEHEIPTLFTNSPKKIINAIESNNFNYNEFKKFTEKNVSLPKNSSCTKNIVKIIKEYL